MESKIKMGVRTTTKFISVVDETGHEILNFCMVKDGSMTIYKAKNLTVFDDAKIEMHCTNPKTDSYIGGKNKILHTPKI